MTISNHTHMPQLETNRCILRMMSIRDADDLFEFYNNEEHLKFLPFKKHDTILDTKRFIKTFFLESYSQGKISHYAIVLKENNKVIGNIGFNNILPGESEGEIGVCLHPDYCGNGFINEVLIEILRYGFKDLKLNRIYAIAFEGNNASINILKRYNFDYVGETLQKKRIKGKYKNINCHIYDIHSNDYIKKTKNITKR